MRNEYPKEIFLDLSLECNLKCIQCDIYKIEPTYNALSIHEKRDIINEIGNWKEEVYLIFTGGEPFKRRDLLYSLSEECNILDIYTTISTNGTLINKKDLKRLPDSGINDVVVSLDSHDPLVHDKIRGIKGTHEKAVESIRKLVEVREKSDNDFHVLTSSILGSHNLENIPELVDLIWSLGVDTILFQPIQPVLNRDVENRWWKANPLFPNSEQVDEGIKALKSLKKEGAPLYQSILQFSDMEYYFKNSGETKPETCISMNEKMMIDIQGNVRLCFNMERIGLEPIGNIKESSLLELWNDSKEKMDKMQDCTECCGIMVCHARR